MHKICLIFLHTCIGVLPLGHHAREDILQVGQLDGPGLAFAGSSVSTGTARLCQHITYNCGSVVV